MNDISSQIEISCWFEYESRNPAGIKIKNFRNTMNSEILEALAEWLKKERPFGEEP